MKEKMKAYCINLDRRPERLEHMAMEFARAGIPFERISAVDGQNPEVAAAATRLPIYRHGLTLSAGAHGCFESHRAVWHRIVDSGDPWALVMEDDLVIAPDMARYLSDDWIPADADIVKMETYAVRIHIGKRGTPVGQRVLHQLHSFHHGTGAYIISARTAQRLLADTRPIGLPVDRAMFDPTSPMRQGLVIYQMVPAPVIQGDRREEGVGTAEWEQTSLNERFDGRPTPAAQESGFILRLRKRWRFRQRIRGLLRGTCYIIVPHG